MANLASELSMHAAHDDSMCGIGLAIAHDKLTQPQP